MVLLDLIEEIEKLNSIEISDKGEKKGNILINQNRELMDINQ